VIGVIAVVVPARDESELVGRCLDSVLAAKARVEKHHRGLSVSVTLVADRCADDTADVARGYPGVTVVEIDAGNVGMARATGVMLALESSGRLPSDVWIASTDADSAVPDGWLLEQLRLARRGAGVVLGSVRPDFEDLSEEQAGAWAALHSAETGGAEVHGANLGVRADVYLAAGGFPSLAEHEDVALVERCTALGAEVVATRRCEVATSGRQVGRTPGGFARYLRDDLLDNQISANPAR